MDIDQRYRQSSSTTITAAELATLLHKSAAGDAESFAAFYRSTNARLMARLTAILRSPGLAQEVSQEVYLQAWSAAGEYDAGGPVRWPG
ncbi:hypothetical protein [Nocardia africana]|uniref:Sigma-K factor n=1 Tax=Nocardia africana TaxID=134964 RepID=A0A378WQC5_9NOCA|nr:hypothetical protein [Nocardia africana]SUA43550.1 Sigma-K factor [Nocardia africana]